MTISTFKKYKMKILMPKAMLLLILLYLSSCCGSRQGEQWEKTSVSCNPAAKPHVVIPKEDSDFFYFKATGYSKNNFSDAHANAKAKLREHVKGSISSKLNKDDYDCGWDEVRQAFVCVVSDVEISSTALSGVLIVEDAERTCETMWQFICKPQNTTRTWEYEVVTIAKYSKLDFRRAMNECIANR